MTNDWPFKQNSTLCNKCYIMEKTLQLSFTGVSSFISKYNLYKINTVMLWIEYRFPGWVLPISENNTMHCNFMIFGIKENLYMLHRFESSVLKYELDNWTGCVSFNNIFLQFKYSTKISEPWLFFFYWYVNRITKVKIVDITFQNRILTILVDNS